MVPNGQLCAKTQIFSPERLVSKVQLRQVGEGVSALFLESRNCLRGKNEVVRRKLQVSETRIFQLFIFCEGFSKGYRPKSNEGFDVAKQQQNMNSTDEVLAPT